MDKLIFLEDQDWNDFLQQVCSQIDSTEKSTGASRAKLNLLCYLCVVAGHREVATRLLHSPLAGSGSTVSLSAWLGWQFLAPLLPCLELFCQWP